MKKLVWSLYAILCYLVGMVSILYLMGFMIDFLVPKSMNAGPSAPLPPTLWMNLITLVVFLGIHSVMARPWFKKRWTRLVPVELERATYVLISGVTTFLLVWCWQPMPDVLWQVDSQVFATVLYGLYALGWITIVLATFNIDHFAFFGLSQVWHAVLNRPARTKPFTARFLYGIVRHPISLGWMILFWSTPLMTVGHLSFALCMTVYILLITPVEEADLIAALGEEYLHYKKRVKAFIPWPG